MKKIIISMAIILTIVIVFACSKSKTSDNNQITNENFLKSKVIDTDDPTSSLELSIPIDNNIIKTINSNRSLGPIATLWRKSSGCHKLGICKWFPNNEPEPIDKSSFIGRKVVFPIIYDVTAKNIKPVFLEFTSAPNYLNDEDITFFVDEDFILNTTVSMNLPFKYLMIPKGVIDYNPSIGNYGGYKVQIIGVN